MTLKLFCLSLSDYPVVLTRRWRCFGNLPAGTRDGGFSPGSLEQRARDLTRQQIRKGGLTFELGLESLVGFLLRKGGRKRHLGRRYSVHKTPWLEKSPLLFHSIWGEAVQREKQHQPALCLPCPKASGALSPGASHGRICSLLNLRVSVSAMILLRGCLLC